MTIVLIFIQVYLFLPHRTSCLGACWQFCNRLSVPSRTCIPVDPITVHFLVPVRNLNSTFNCVIFIALFFCCRLCAKYTGWMSLTLLAEAIFSLHDQVRSPPSAFSFLSGEMRGLFTTSIRRDYNVEGPRLILLTSWLLGLHDLAISYPECLTLPSFSIGKLQLLQFLLSGCLRCMEPSFPFMEMSITTL